MTKKEIKAIYIFATLFACVTFAFAFIGAVACIVYTVNVEAFLITKVSAIIFYGLFAILMFGCLFVNVFVCVANYSVVFAAMEDMLIEHK